MLRLLLIVGVFVGNLLLSNFHNHDGIFENQSCPAYVISHNPTLATELPGMVLNEFQLFTLEEKTFKTLIFSKINFVSPPSTRSPPTS